MVLLQLFRPFRQLKGGTWYRWWTRSTTLTHHRGQKAVKGSIYNRKRPDLRASFHCSKKKSPLWKVIVYLMLGLLNFNYFDKRRNTLLINSSRILEKKNGYVLIKYSEDISVYLITTLVFFEMKQKYYNKI